MPAFHPARHAARLVKAAHCLERECMALRHSRKHGLEQLFELAAACRHHGRVSKRVVIASVFFLLLKERVQVVGVHQINAQATQSRRKPLSEGFAGLLSKRK